ncbi:hypothetical protein BJ138DRAFT_1145055 [Hygrophoropsis aurantiaca]|uniref:Uncharacterized protein n=1 Tax=Hygrophoropsis aurantiaca TaxID=72124 RepID=A0ACB8AKM2_9AGAM|nr:hypothetical protein BJ138DRAFT_1145055 [Hygrophoropsis aurantiaca]
MPQQVDHAALITLDNLDENDVGRKLRVAGRMLTYDSESAIVLLYEAPHALLVDVALCVDPDVLLSWNNGKGVDVIADGDGDMQRSAKRSKDRNVDPRWAIHRKSYVWVVGYLERACPQIPIPILPAFLPPPDIDPSLVMRALIVTPAEDLNEGPSLRLLCDEIASLPPTPYPI